MKKILIATITLGTIFVTMNADAKTKRGPASASICSGKQEDYRAFVITGIAGDEDGETKLSAPIGSTSESINCTANTFSTKDVKGNSTGELVTFNFKSTKSCNKALEKIKTATKELPAVVIIDKKDCEAHIAL